MANVPQHFLDDRRRRRGDRWDEVWDGVLHMPRWPNIEHQDLEGEMETWLRRHWAKPRGNKAYHQINVAPPGGWPDKNYRIPDLVLLTRDCAAINRSEYLEGAPTVVVEIHSPGDEACEKLPFYAELGVPEVWIIDRDSRKPAVHVLGQGGYEVCRPANDGWIQSEATGIELRASRESKPALRIAGDETTRDDMPAG